MLDDIDRILAETGLTPEILHDDIEPFRPTNRPPMGRFILFDDGATEGEVIRIRKDSTSIGRTGCDVNILHDEWISDRHLQISREKHGDLYSWVIKDLDTTTGFWVRVRQAELRNGTEFLAGRGKFIVEFPQPMSELDLLEFENRLSNGSIPGASADSATHYPTLRQEPRFEGDRVAARPVYLLGNEYWLGRDRGCDLAVPSDSFLGRKHIRIYRSDDNKWMADSGGITNGMWIRLKRIVVHKSCTFQIGEQRCRFTCSWDRDEY